MSGTPPQDLLDRPLVEQVAGDRIAGFYRPRLDAERDDDTPGVGSPRRPDAPQLEAYSWGGLTSGSAGRALWLVLLPFTLVNLAPRARPPHDGKTWTTGVIWYLSRLLALLMTMLLVLAAAGVGEDLIGWQCAGNRNRCTKAKPRWLFDVATDGHHTVESGLLLGAALPVLVLVALWVVSTRSARRYEKTVVEFSGGHSPTEEEQFADRDAVEVGLSSPLMWHGEWQVRRLRAVHMQAGFATILWTLIVPTRAPLWSVAPLAVVAYALVVLGVPRYTGRGRSAWWAAGSAIVWVTLVGTATYEALQYGLGSTWLDSGYLGDPRAGARPVAALPFYGVTVLAEFAATVGVLLLLLVAVIVAALRGGSSQPCGEHERQPPAFWRTGTAVFAALGVFLAAAFSAGVYLYSAAWLNTGSIKPGFTAVSRITRDFLVPDAVRAASDAFAVAVLVLLAMLVLAGGWFVWVFRLFPGSFRVRALVPKGALERDYGTKTVKSDPKRRQAVTRAVFLGRLVDVAPGGIGFLTAVGLTVTIIFTSGSLWSDERDQLSLSQAHYRDGLAAPGTLQAVGAYFAVILLIGLVTLGAAAFRVPATRRVVGILWDVASFWPRSCHPLAAPCYAERTVPDLVTRISAFRVQRAYSALVLSAHSQGSVIGAATIFQLDAFDRLVAKGLRPAPALPDLGFLTFGCVLRRLYGRYFPAYFGPARLAELQDILTSGRDRSRSPRWINLWRYTDYLGGQVTAGPAPTVPAVATKPVRLHTLITEAPATGPRPWEWHSPDPALFARPDGDTSYQRPGRHSGFWLDPSGYFQLAASTLVEQIRREHDERLPKPTRVALVRRWWRMSRL